MLLVLTRVSLGHPLQHRPAHRYAHWCPLWESSIWNAKKNETLIVEAIVFLIKRTYLHDLYPEILWPKTADIQTDQNLPTSLFSTCLVPLADVLFIDRKRQKFTRPSILNSGFFPSLGWRCLLELYLISRKVDSVRFPRTWHRTNNTEEVQQSQNHHSKSFRGLCLRSFWLAAN